METIIIDGVKCRKIDNKHLELTIPHSWNGVKLQKWQDKNKKIALQQLSE